MKLFLASWAPWKNKKLEEEFLALLPKPRNQNKLFILTIDTTSNFHVELLKQAIIWYKEKGFQDSNIKIYNLKTEQIPDFRDIQVLHIWGGNNYHYLQSIKEKGLEPKIREFIERDGVYVGSSAGSNIMAPDLDENLSNDVNDICLDDVKCFGYIDFHLLVHWDTTEGQARTNQIRYAWKNGKRVLPLTDEQAVMVVDSGYHIISPDIY